MSIWDKFVQRICVYMGQVRAEANFQLCIQSFFARTLVLGSTYFFCDLRKKKIQEVTVFKLVQFLLPKF